jgi:hypothetical protein
MVSKISNAKDTQDKLQDVEVFNSYIHYIAKPESSEDSDEQGESLDRENETKAFEINYAEEFKEVTKVFDKYSDFYIDDSEFQRRGELGTDDTEVTPVDDEE